MTKIASTGASPRAEAKEIFGPGENVYRRISRKGVHFLCLSLSFSSLFLSNSELFRATEPLTNRCIIRFNLAMTIFTILDKSKEMLVEKILNYSTKFST